jgi:hypothetical protein
LRSESGGTGRHAGFRFLCRKAWGFESPLSHLGSRCARRRPAVSPTPRPPSVRCAIALALVAVAGAGVRAAGPQGPALERLRHNNPGLVVDLGVGLWAWPLPMDYDGDGDLDLVVSCPDTPCNGTYLFENPGGDRKFPVFKALVRIAPGLPNVRPSYIGGSVRVLTPAHELVDFRTSHLEKARTLYPTTNLAGPDARLRANQWQLADVDDDGRLDLVVDSRNATVLRNVGAGDGFTTFRNGTPVASLVLAGHSGPAHTNVLIQ